MNQLLVKGEPAIYITNTKKKTSAYLAEWQNGQMNHVAIAKRQSMTLQTH